MNWTPAEFLMLNVDLQFRQRRTIPKRILLRIKQGSRRLIMKLAHQSWIHVCWRIVAIIYW